MSFPRIFPEPVLRNPFRHLRPRIRLARTKQVMFLPTKPLEEPVLEAVGAMEQVAPKDVMGALPTTTVCPRALI